MSIMPQKDTYTYEEWLNLDDNEKIDLIDGALYIRGEPSRRHMDVIRELSAEFTIFLRGKPCKLYTNPFMVKLSKKTVVHPDICIICDKNKVTGQGCIGAPDLIIEVLLPSNAGDSIFTKYNKYFITGVKEYWIVDPHKNTIIVYILKYDNYRARLYSENDILPVGLLPGLTINLKMIFETE